MYLRAVSGISGQAKPLVGGDRCHGVVTTAVPLTNRFVLATYGHVDEIGEEVGRAVLRKHLAPAALPSTAAG